MASRRPKLYPHQTSRQAPPNELRMEFTSPNGGGLLTLTTTEDGRLMVDVHQYDPTVTVRTGSDFDPRPAVAFMTRHPERFTDQEFRHAATGRCLFHQHEGTQVVYCMDDVRPGWFYCEPHGEALDTPGVEIPRDV